MRQAKLTLTISTILATITGFGAMGSGNNPHTSFSTALTLLALLVAVNLMEADK